MPCVRACAALRIGALLTCAALPLPASACAGVAGRKGNVRVVDESAVIVWDAATHQERFIRRATFNTASKNFGFLVPTPSVPTLTEADDSVFRSFESVIQPKVIEQKQSVFTPSSLLFPTLITLSGSRNAGANARDEKRVQVMEMQHVAGYDAVVLSADNADALQKWLQSHGYVAHPALLAWLTPYIQAHWKITAFKISKYHSGDGYTASSAVSMAFKTDRPFFPYREPANQRIPGHYAASRSLRIFFLSAARAAGKLGDSALPASWPGSTVFASPITDAQRADLNKTLSLSAHPSAAHLWLTTFEDLSSPRPGTDEVYFAPAPQQTPVTPPPVIVKSIERIYVPMEPLLLAAGTGVFFFTFKRQRRRGARRSGR